MVLIQGGRFNPRFCVNCVSSANRTKFIQGGSREIRLPPPGPLFHNIHHGQIQLFQQAVIAGKARFVLGLLTQPAVDALNGVDRIDQSSHLLGILKIGAEIGPVDPPGLGDFRVFLVLAISKGVP